MADFALYNLLQVHMAGLTRYILHFTIKELLIHESRPHVYVTIGLKCTLHNDVCTYICTYSYILHTCIFNTFCNFLTTIQN